MNEFKNATYIGERALFATKDASIFRCIFEDGESPLKESSNLTINKTEFRWKYPLWYCTDVTVENTKFLETARSGIWYTKNITMRNCLIEAPKTFRYAKNVVLEDVAIPNAQETFWNSADIKLSNVKIKGDYLGFHSENVEIDNMDLDGNYCFDSAKNIVIKNSILRSKDSFWNSENVTVINCAIIGEYLAWNSKNLTFINCTIESHQGLCYIDNLKLVNTKLVNTDLCFEYCSNIDADIISSIDSVKNPYSGIISAYEIKELILDEKFVDPSKTTIKIGNRYE